jgi:hypothetical protein
MCVGLQLSVIVIVVAQLCDEIARRGDVERSGKLPNQIVGQSRTSIRVLWLRNECDACTRDYEAMIAKVVSRDYVMSVMVAKDVARGAE